LSEETQIAMAEHFVVHQAAWLEQVCDPAYRRNGGPAAEADIARVARQLDEVVTFLEAHK